MRHIVALGLAAALIACSESPKPAAKAPPPAPSAPVTAAPQAQPQPEPPKPDPNKELAAKVKQALEAPKAKLPAGGIDVTAADGKVSLWGTVETDQQRRRAAQIAGKVDGVKGVDNQLKVVKGS
ncbi:MAG TPA: BON domain-containing protein [Burkholderiales bacterium]|jgi:glucose/arabinose dehydrogenase|nr:BON domain-containing protein [Burkholderiales bacterium]